MDGRPAEPLTPVDVAVVGGGLSGLTLAYELRALGLSVVLLEASSRLGGVILTERREGYLIEGGAHGFLDKEPATRSLIDRLGLSPEVTPAEPAVEHRRYLFTRGALRAAPSSPPGFLRSDLLPLSARLRVLGELLIPRRKDTSGPEADESVAAFARRRLGPRAAAVLVDAMQTGIYAGDPERLSTAACFPLLARLEREHRSLILGLVRRGRGLPQLPDGAPPLTGRLCSFREGMESLPKALGRALGRSAWTAAAVTGLARDGNGWRVDVNGPDGNRSLRAGALVLTVPAYAAAGLLRPLDAALAAELSGIDYAPVGVVHLGYPSQAVSGVPSGFGFLAPHEEGLNLLGTFFVSQFFAGRARPGRTLFTCMVGGARRPEPVLAGDGPLREAAERDLKRAVGLQGPPEFAHAVRWTRAIPQYHLGHLRRLEAIEARLRTFPSLHLTGNSYRGVGVNDCIRNAGQLAREIADTRKVKMARVT